MAAAPKVSSTISSRYAAALLDLAEETGKVEKVEQDLKDLESMIAVSADFHAMVRSPLLSRRQKGEAVLALAKKAKFQTLTANFLGTLAQNRRLYALEAILKAAKTDLARRRGEIQAEVQSAVALTASQTKALQAALSKAVGSDVLLEAKVNPDILGGTIVTVGSQMIDDSVTRKLTRMRVALQGQANQNAPQEKAS